MKVIVLESWPKFNFTRARVLLRFVILVIQMVSKLKIKIETLRSKLKTYHHPNHSFIRIVSKNFTCRNIEFKVSIENDFGFEIKFDVTCVYDSSNRLHRKMSLINSSTKWRNDISDGCASEKKVFFLTHVTETKVLICTEWSKLARVQSDFCVSKAKLQKSISS